jgi:hypothetical protein
MSVDYIVASLPELHFAEKAPISWEDFLARAGDCLDLGGFDELETEIRNAMAEARSGEEFKRGSKTVSLYWKNRTLACFQEQDVARRERMLDKVWWDAAAELTDVTSPLGKGALATYAVRLKIALKYSRLSGEEGARVLERAISPAIDVNLT